MPNGNLRTQNLKMLFEKAKQYEKTTFKGLYNFISFIDKLKLSSGDMSVAKLIGENENVVRIMSIHKSKGLEFPIAIISRANKKFNQKDLTDTILMHQDIGIGMQYVNYDRQIEYTTAAKEAIKLKYPNIHVDEQVNTQEKQNFINNLKLNLSRKKLEENEISEKLETLTEIGEKLNITSQEYKELIEYDDVINISKNALNNAYLEMKESITPKFTENLSYLVKDITSGKYNKIKVNEENGLALETANRKLCYSKLFK